MIAGSGGLNVAVAGAMYPSVVSVGLVDAAPASSTNWHAHDFDELCLVSGGQTTIGHAGQPVPAGPGSLFLFRRGEAHGYWNRPGQACQLAVLHFRLDDQTYEYARALDTADAASRVWVLDDDRQEAFLSLFNKVVAENASRRAGWQAAESAWIRLLLVAVARWGVAVEPIAPSPRVDEPEIVQMWHLLRVHTGDQASLVRSLRERFENYDSLRRTFTRSAGRSPTAAWRELRLAHAAHLLLTTQRSVKEIARGTGYARQHEFTRAFTRHHGVSPQKWRRTHVG